MQRKKLKFTKNKSCMSLVKDKDIYNIYTANLKKVVLSKLSTLSVQNCSVRLRFRRLFLFLRIFHVYKSSKNNRDFIALFGVLLYTKQKSVLATTPSFL